MSSARAVEEIQRLVDGTPANSASTLQWRRCGVARPDRIWEAIDFDSPVAAMISVSFTPARPSRIGAKVSEVSGLALALDSQRVEGRSKRQPGRWQAGGGSHESVGGRARSLVARRRGTAPAGSLELPAGEVRAS